MEKIKKILRFDNSKVVEAVNKAGGMALLWKEEIKISKILVTTFTIEALVEDQESKSKWWLVGVYASYDSQIRKQQWRIIRDRKKLWGENWIIAGDFNDIVSNEEKWGGNWREKRSFWDFKNFIMTTS